MKCGNGDVASRIALDLSLSVSTESCELCAPLVFCAICPQRYNHQHEDVEGRQYSYPATTHLLFCAFLLTTSTHRVWIRSERVHLVMPGCMVDRGRTPRTLGSGSISLLEVRRVDLSSFNQRPRSRDENLALGLKSGYRDPKFGLMATMFRPFFLPRRDLVCLVSKYLADSTSVQQETVQNPKRSTREVLCFSGN